MNEIDSNQKDHPGARNDTDPIQAEAHFKKAWALRIDGKYRESIEEFKVSLGFLKKGATYFNLALMHDKVEEGELAWEAAQSAFQMFKENNDTKNINATDRLLKKLHAKYCV